MSVSTNTLSYSIEHVSSGGIYKQQDLAKNLPSSRKSLPQKKFRQSKILNFNTLQNLANNRTAIEIQEVLPGMAERSSSTPDNGLGTLSILPLEIREMIYAPLFGAGHTALALASKAMSEDTKSTLYQHGVYHMEIEYLYDSGSYRWKVVRKPSPTILPRIRNLHVCVKYGTHMNIHGVNTIRFPGSAPKDDDITSVFQATWKSSPDDPNGIFHKLDTAPVINSAVLSLESQSLASLVRQLVDHMEKPGRCFFKCDVLQSTTEEMPPAVFDSMKLLRRFPYVVTEFSYGPYHNRESAEIFLEGFNNTVAANLENTKRILEPRGDSDQRPELKISHAVSYFLRGGFGNLSVMGVKSWGDEPEDRDCGLGEWTEASGRVWRPKSA